jgi:hypothetical protein
MALYKYGSFLTNLTTQLLMRLTRREPRRPTPASTAVRGAATRSGLPKVMHFRLRITTATRLPTWNGVFACTRNTEAASYGVDDAGLIRLSVSTGRMNDDPKNR